MYNKKRSRVWLQPPDVKKLTLLKLRKWGFSSAGRAPALHAGGQEFESPNLHNKKQDDVSYPVFYYVRVRFDEKLPKIR